MGGKLPAESIAAIETWIQGLKPEQAKSGQKRHWAFVPPAVRDPQGAGIDRFVTERLAKAGVPSAPEADKRTLIRRLYFDLIGIPPSPAEVERFVNDTSPQAYSALVDQLLADRRYGERWGRYWLDLARYSDTNGYEGDTDFPNAWRYRNYVIDAFNSDKPYDTFIKEQIAGDEFFQVVSAVPAPPPEPERVVAMTFLRLAPFNRTPVSDENRDSYLTEVTSTVGSVFLGLTVGCAKCHDHKYDEIPQKDFYRMKAFFATVQITNTGRVGGTEPAAFYRPGEKERIEKRAENTKNALQNTENALKEMQKPLLEKLAAHSKKTPELKDLEKAIDNEGDNTASLDSKERVFSKEEVERYSNLKVAIRQHKRMLERLEPVAMSVRNADGPPFGPSVPTTYVQVRGAYDRLGEAVEPGFLSAITGNSEAAELELDRYKMFPTRGRRMTLAKWIASPDNPLTARVMVNRMWQYHFGRGIVDTPSDFGRNGTAPTHPELLDWLAFKFVENKWSVKSMHRLILNSATYKQSAKPANAKVVEADPEARLLSRFPRRRLEGEVIRDTVLSVSGRLNEEPQDLPTFPALPEGLDEAQKVQGFNTWETATGPEARTRSVYVFQRRSLNYPLLETFDASVPTTSCSRRVISTTPLQALTLYNGEFANEESRAFAKRVLSEAGTDAGKQVERAFLLAYGRLPTAAERRQALQFLDSLAGSGDALDGLCRVLINSSEFVYLD
jgi:hypothetical protein